MMEGSRIEGGSRIEDRGRTGEDRGGRFREVGGARVKDRGGLEVGGWRRQDGRGGCNGRGRIEDRGRRGEDRGGSRLEEGGAGRIEGGSRED